MTGEALAPKQWRRLIGPLPFISRGRAKRLLERAARAMEAARQGHQEAQRRVDSIRGHARAVGNDHVPSTEHLMDRLRLGNYTGRDVRVHAFCASCRLPWPCPTYRLADVVGDLALGWDPREHTRATITVTQQTEIGQQKEKSNE